MDYRTRSSRSGIACAMLCALLAVTALPGHARDGSTAPSLTDAAPKAGLGTGPVVQLPLELLGVGRDPMVVESRLNLSASGASAATTLAFTCHRCSFFSAPEWEQTSRTPTTVKASARVLGGIDSSQDGSVAWVDITESNVELPDAERLQGGLGISGMYTARIRLPLDQAARDRLTANAAGNRIQFRFNGTEGESNGYRVLELDFRGAAGEGLATNPVQYADIALEKAASYPPADVAAGDALWHAGGLLEKSSIVSRRLAASCASCHAKGGRDLQYFNYSNNAIRQRAMFHGLGSADANRIVAYVRSNPGSAVHVARATPWNPPYQPGPGLDSRPIKEWAAGAGLDAVLETPARAANALFGHPIDDVPRTVTQAEIDGLMDPNAVNNARETAISLQFPDWNAWLPAISPEDVWPDALATGQPDSEGSFNLGAKFSADNSMRYPKQRMQEIDDWLAQRAGSTWGNWAHLTDGERFSIAQKMNQAGWNGYFFVGGGRGNHIASSGKYGAQVGAANLLRFGHPPTMALNPAGTTVNSFIERTFLAMMQWSVVQEWGMVQQYGLEGDQKWFIPRFDSTPSNFIGIGESRGWPFNTASLFFIGPHMAYQEDRDAQGNLTRDYVFAWENRQHPVGSYYRTNIWYDLQMVVNSGGTETYTNFPIDWPYHTTFTSLLADELTRLNTPEAKALANTHLLRQLQIKAKLGQAVNNPRPLSAPPSGQWSFYQDDGRLGRAGTITQIMPASWILSSPMYGRAQHELLDEYQPGLYLKAVNGSFHQFNHLLGRHSGRPVGDWRRCDPHVLAVDRMEPWFVGHFCMDRARGVLPLSSQGQPSLADNLWITSTEYMLYGAYKGAQIGVEGGRLQDYTTWMDWVWPGPSTSADMQALASAPARAGVGREIVVTTYCKNLGATGAPAESNVATNVHCAVSSAPPNAVTTCTPAVPTASLAAGASVVCTTRFTPTEPGTLRLRSDATSDSFDPVPRNAWVTTTIVVNNDTLFQHGFE